MSSLHWDHKKQRHLKGEGKILSKSELKVAFIFPKMEAFWNTRGFP